VTTMAYMFYEATSFNQPLEKWDVSNVTTGCRWSDDGYLRALE